MWSLVVHPVSQDLSVAGKRAGLAGARSGLFMEQIRIIKEMRDADVRRGRTGQFIRPRFMVWENVPGAFSSNGGDDFRAVLEETIRIADPDAPDIPLPPKGKWPLADCWMGDGWSVAYRVLDAQFWGVPQRRRRIALVADFGGHAAPEISFVRKSVCGGPAQGGPEGEETAAGAGSGAADTVWCLQGNVVDREAKMNGLGIAQEPMFTLNTIDRHAVCEAGGDEKVICLNDQGGSVIGTSVDVAGTLRAQEHGHQPIVCAGFKPHMGAKARSIGYEEEKAPTVDTGKANAVYDARGNGDGKTVCTLTGDHQSRITDYTAIVMATGQGGAEILDNLCTTLNCNHEQPIMCAGFNPEARATAGTIGYKKELSPTIDTGSPHAVIVGTFQNTGQGWWNESDVGATLRTPCGGDAIKANLVVNEERGERAVVRRLTPLECERLQGYPDGWTVLQEIGDMTDSEYEFWKSVLFEKEKREGRVRLSEAGVWEIWKYTKVKDEEDGGHWENTYKPYKPKEKSKMIKWYNNSFCKDSDSARYKALGNSIALPPWSWVLKRLCACYERTATMASLFDGIGGFPLIWERLNGPGSCLWASEIEEFPIAVTKERFDGKRRW